MRPCWPGSRADGVPRRRRLHKTNQAAAVCRVGWGTSNYPRRHAATTPPPPIALESASAAANPIAMNCATSFIAVPLIISEQ